VSFIPVLFTSIATCNLSCCLKSNAVTIDVVCVLLVAYLIIRVIGAVVLHNVRARHFIYTGQCFETFSHSFRNISLGFRLLANISAGHLVLSLFLILSVGAIAIGSLINSSVYLSLLSSSLKQQ
jgi:F0F1-type ATP synthase membrane subunit a